MEFLGKGNLLFANNLENFYNKILFHENIVTKEQQNVQLKNCLYCAQNPRKKKKIKVQACVGVIKKRTRQKKLCV